MSAKDPKNSTKPKFYYFPIEHLKTFPNITTYQNYNITVANLARNKHNLPQM